MKKFLAPVGAALLVLVVSLSLALVTAPGQPVKAAVAYKHGTFAAASSGAVTVLTPTSGTRWTLKDLYLSGDTAGVYAIKDGAGGTTILNPYSAANGEIHRDSSFFGQLGIRAAAVDNVIQLVGPSASTCRIDFSYMEE